MSGDFDQMLRHGNLLLEDGFFDQAKACFSRCLDFNAEAAEAYLGLLMADMQAKNRFEAREKFIAGNYIKSPNWKRAKQFADYKLTAAFTVWEKERDAHAQAERDAYRQKVNEAQQRMEEEEAYREANEKNVAAAQRELGLLTQEIQALEEDRADKLLKIRGTRSFQKRNLTILTEQLTVLNQQLMSRYKRRNLLGVTLYAGKCIAGDLFEFGCYETGAGIKPICWRVLKCEKERILLFSEYVIDSGVFHCNEENTTWEQCSLRSWLNKDFVEAAFSEDEREIIDRTVCPADINPIYSLDAGQVTLDRVFLLSAGETVTYVSKRMISPAVPTEFALQRGCRLQKGTGLCNWWTRTPGKALNEAATTSIDGSVVYSGVKVISTGIGIRPAIWLDLSR